MELFLKKYSNLFKLSKTLDIPDSDIEFLIEKANQSRITACDNQDEVFYEKASYFYFLCSSYFFKKYQENKNISNFYNICLYKYEQLKSYFSNLYCKKLLEPKDLLKILTPIINFMKDFLKILKEYTEFNEEFYKFESLAYSDRIIMHQIKSNLYFKNRDFINATSEMKMVTDLTKNHIKLLQQDVFNEIFDIVHLRTEEINLKLRLCEYKELAVINISKTNIPSTISNLLDCITLTDEAFEINPNISEIMEKKQSVLNKIFTVLSQNLQLWNILYTNHKTNSTLLSIMAEIDKEKIEEILLSDFSNKGNVLILNSGVFQNTNGIIGNGNSLKSNK